MSIRRMIMVVLPMLLGLSLLAGCRPAEEAGEAVAPEEATVGAGTAAELAYRNAVNPPPEGWTGPVFDLSHDYPRQSPGTCPPETCAWLTNEEVDFSDSSPTWEEGWDDYMQSILDYVKAGQELSPQGWNVMVDGETRWYHVPWMAYDPTSGREFIHGFTNERTAYLSDFLGAGHGIHNLPGNEERFETWAFGVYNPWGGYAIGQTWNEAGDPVMAGDPSLPAGLPFPEGTLVAKLLFTTATPEQVGYLEGSPEWTANRHVNTTEVCERTPQPVHLVQMDVAVVDTRSPTRWVYGTFGFNGTLLGESPWERLSPLGLMWGNDPQSWPAVSEEGSQPIQQSVLAAINIYEHFGCNGRLAGPVDNKLSACLACHGGGYVARPAGSISTMGENIPPIFGFDTLCEQADQANADYFANVAYPEPYTGGGYPETFSVDSSLQLQVAFIQYGLYHTNGQPKPCTEGG